MAHRSITTSLLITTLLASFPQVMAAPLTPKEKDTLHQAVMKKEKATIETDATRREDDALTSVFSPTFYDVTILQHSTTHTQEKNALLISLDGQMIELKHPTTNEHLPNLQRILKQDFHLKTAQDALILEEALDILYPISTSFGSDDLDKKAIQQKGNQWFFIRGAFFDNLAGFVFTTDASGKVTDVSYSLGIPASLPSPSLQPETQPLTEAEQQAIHTAILAREQIEIKTDGTRLENKALSTAFNAQFYDTTITQVTKDYSSESEMMLAIQNDQVIELEDPSTNQSVPELKAILKTDFRLKTQQDAAFLEEALDILYPIEVGFGREDLEHKAIQQKGNQWFFIRGVFFRDLKGFVFQTDDSGNILSVDYSLEIPNNQ